MPTPDLLTPDELPPLITRELIMQVSGCSSRVVDRWRLEPVDRREIPADELRAVDPDRPLTDLRMARRPFLFRRDDVLPLINAYMDKRARREPPSGDPPFAVEREVIIRMPGWTPGQSRRAEARFLDWARAHELQRGRCVSRTGHGDTWWEAKWTDDDGMVSYGWYRRTKSPARWSAAVLRFVKPALDGLWRPIPDGEFSGD